MEKKCKKSEEPIDHRIDVDTDKCIDCGKEFEWICRAK